MKKITLLLLGTALITSTAYAGSSIFGGGKHKQASNPYGVDSINIHVCGSLECPPVRIVEGSCDGENMFQRWGVCVCEKGYVAIGARCRTCPDGYISDGIHECQPCPTGTYRAHQSDTTCTDCPDIHAIKCNSKGKSTECEDGYVVHEGECVSVDTGVCENGNVYLSYMPDPCATETPMEGRVCTNDVDCEGTFIKNTGCCDTEKQQCKADISYDRDTHNTYVCPKDNRNCKKNSDCNSGEFCNLVSNNSIKKPDTGTCTALVESIDYTYIKDGLNKTFWMSYHYLTWWGAENWCKAQGRNLVSYDTINLLFDCDKNTKVCNSNKLKNADYWKNKQPLPPVYSYWTSENYDPSSNFAMDLFNSGVYLGTPYIGYTRQVFALCE